MALPRVLAESLEARSLFSGSLFSTVGAEMTMSAPVAVADAPLEKVRRARAAMAGLQAKVAARVAAATASVGPTASALSVTLNVRLYGALGNGLTDDAAAIQRAIDAAGATVGGGSVYLPAGTYVVSSQILLASNTELVGDPGRTTIRLRDGSVNRRLIVGYKVQNVALRNLVIDANRQWTVAVNNAAGEGTGAFFSECDDVEVSNCTVRNARWYGVWLSDTSNSRVLNNLVQDCGVRGIFVAVNVLGSRNNTVSGNTVERIDDTGQGAGSGIAFAGSVAEGGIRAERFTISNNVTRNNGRCGILVSGVRDFTISGNTRHGNKTHTVLGKGIQVSEASDRGTITGNTCYDNRGGIDVDVITPDHRVNFGDITIRDNTTHSNAVHGIHINHTQRVNIDRNNTYGNDYGILLNGRTSDTVIQRNTVSDNRTSGIALTTEERQPTETGQWVPGWILRTTIRSNRIVRSGVGAQQNQIWHAGLMFIRAHTVNAYGNVLEGNRFQTYVDDASVGVRL